MYRYLFVSIYDVTLCISCKLLRYRLNGMYLDFEVVDACKTHMRSVCGDTMDTMEGSNYKVFSLFILYNLNVKYDHVSKADWQIIKSNTKNPWGLTPGNG